MRLEMLMKIAEEEVVAALGLLPPEVQREAEAVPVLFGSSPTEVLSPEEGGDENLLGLFTGESFCDRGHTLDPMPAQIFLFLENLWEYADRDEEIFREEVMTTYLHELGHYLGWDEEDLAGRDLD